ncbi:MBL fold metallo-hydrolase [Halorussus halophilus]|uniref:MBL fold metallo-hydrolase n=1 Tax=Halorussus halophilus TaxID=2650975 RepID=UPI001300FAC7|nr:MBL fold metallo-hydrolase [Halorussus halophilus]
MEIRRIAVPVETFAPGGTTNAYLLDGDESLLVDPAARTDELDELADSRGIDHVLVTHSHPDHVGAVAHYAQRYDATVWSRAGREDRFEAATNVVPDRTFREGTTIGDATVMETPGHAPDHVALVFDSGIVTGDLVVAEGSVVVGADEGDVRAYLTSLRRLYARNPDRLYPGHGPEIDDSRATVERLIRHRLAREAKVLAAVRGGATTLDEILDAAYEKDLTGVRELACSTVAAHLEKLAVEQKVAWDGSVAETR